MRTKEISIFGRGLEVALTGGRGRRWMGEGRMPSLVKESMETLESLSTTEMSKSSSESEDRFTQLFLSLDMRHDCICINGT